MPKFTLNVPEEMDRALRLHSEKSGMPIAEFIRRAVARDLRKAGYKVAWRMAWGGAREVDGLEEDEQGQRVAELAG